MMNDDMELVREYAARQSEQAFQTLVARYINLVYATALRQVRDPHLAKEITQAVFIILARKANSLGAGTILPSWLHRTAVFAAADTLKRQRRRAQREQEAQMQSEIQSAESNPAWELISPLLDEALVHLGEKDRQAVLLHFFERKTFAEVGGSLDMSEETARKRTNRALEKLRKIFSKHGVHSTTAILAGAISINSQQVTPAALATSVAALAVTKGATAGSSTLTLVKGALKLMAWTKAKTAITVGVCALLALSATTTVVLEKRAEKIEKLWRMNKDVPRAQIDSLPPMVKMLPTKFKPPWVNWNAGANGDKFAGARARAGDIAVYAFGFPRGRIRFTDGEPTNRFDFVATMPHGNAEALQQALKARLGLVERKEMENMDVLLLKVARANAPGLKPAIPNKHDNYSKAGIFHSSNEAIDTGAPRFEGLAHYLEYYFKTPVIDQTGLTQYFSMELRWKEESGQHNSDGLKAALLDRFGLELVPTNMPLEVLVLDKVR